MKSILPIVILLTIIVVSPLFSDGHWEQVRKKADWEFPLDKVFFINEKKGWILGHHTQLLFTTNGGQQWNRHYFSQDIKQGITGYLQDICFINEQTGWIVGNEGIILKTTDGGESWYFQNSGTNLYLEACAFSDELNGWAVGESGLIICTRDGGESWIQQSIGTTITLNHVCFIDSLKGWAVGKNSTVMITTDGGETWEKKNIASGNTFIHVHFLNDSLGWAVGDYATIIKTIDGGLNWTVHKKITGSDELLTSVYFINDSIGWVTGGWHGDCRVLMKTTDGGETWNSQNSQHESDLTDIFFINDTLGWSVGFEGTILFTNDGGTTWNWQMNFPSSSLNSVHFTTNLNGWAVGVFTLIHTSDGGVTWEYIDDMEGNDIFFINEQKGWVVHGGEGIYFTDDYGKTWELQYSGPGYYSIHFINENCGWTFGSKWDSTYALCTKNGGKTWEKLFEMSDYNLICFCFVDSLHGWMTGSNGVIMNTIDGGFTWKIQKQASQGIESALFDIFFVDQYNGWAVGYGGQIWHTTNGGRTWSEQQSNTWQVLVAIDFFDANEGWVVGWCGCLLHTTDGGNNWDNSYSEDWGYWWDDVYFTDRNHGWVIGGAGTVYKWIPDTKVTMKEKNLIPDEFILSQNYPNPFNPETKISYCLPTSGYVTIKIYDITGREIRTLVNARKASGYYNIQWDGKDNNGTNAASGIYIYSMKTSSFTQSKKMVLVR